MNWRKKIAPKWVRQITSYVNEKMCLLNVLNLQSKPALNSIHHNLKFKTAKLFPKDDVDYILMRNVHVIHKYFNHRMDFCTSTEHAKSSQLCSKSLMERWHLLN